MLAAAAPRPPPEPCPTMLTPTECVDHILQRPGRFLVRVLLGFRKMG